MEPLVSKFLPPILAIEDPGPKGRDSDSSDGEDGRDDRIDLSFLLASSLNIKSEEPLFVIDSKPSTEEEIKASQKAKFKPNQPKLTLDPGKDVSGLLNFRNASDAISFMNKSASAEEVYGSKSVTVKPDFHQVDQTIRPMRLSKRVKKKLNKQKQEETAGDKWFGMPATELTEELKNDIKVLQMRDALDPKRHYKRNNELAKKTPKYFHVGKIIAPPADFYNSLTRKQRKQTIVDELLADAEWQRRQKAKFTQIIKSNPRYLRIARRKEIAKSVAKLKGKSKSAPSNSKNALRRGPQFIVSEMKE